MTMRSSLAVAAALVLAGSVLAACGGLVDAPLPATDGDGSGTSSQENTGTEGDADRDADGDTHGDDLGVSASGDQAVSLDLVGKQFESTKTIGFDVVDGHVITVAFPEEDQVSVNAGCNQLFGNITWDLTGEAAFSAPALASTMMACDDALMAQDTFLAGLFADGFTVDYWATGELFLTQGDIAIELTKTGAVTDHNGTDADSNTDPDDGIADMEQPLSGDTPASQG